MKFRTTRAQGAPIFDYANHGAVVGRFVGVVEADGDMMPCRVVRGVFTPPQESEVVLSLSGLHVDLTVDGDIFCLYYEEAPDEVRPE